MTSSSSPDPAGDREPDDPPIRALELPLAPPRSRSEPPRDMGEEFGQLRDDLHGALGGLFRTRTADYQVPKRFGMGPLLGMMLLYSIIFAALRWGNAPQWLYLFLGVLGVVIGFGQMQGQSSPRLSSIVTGAFALPGLFLAFAGLLYLAGGGRGVDLLSLVCTPVALFFVGGFVGYLVGTVLAGVFLVGDRIEQALLSRTSRRRNSVGDGDLSDGVTA